MIVRICRDMRFSLRAFLNHVAIPQLESAKSEPECYRTEDVTYPALRRRVQAGLNKGEARNALARAVFMHRLGEIRGRKLENQSYRASRLTLLTAAISLWNTVYMERAIDALKRKGLKINEQLLSHLSPLGWEHINLTGDYIWKSNRIPASGKFRRLRPAKVERSKNNLNEWKGLPLIMRLINSCAIMGYTSSRRNSL